MKWYLQKHSLRGVASIKCSEIFGQIIWNIAVKELIFSKIAGLSLLKNELLHRYFSKISTQDFLSIKLWKAIHRTPLLLPSTCFLGTGSSVGTALCCKSYISDFTQVSKTKVLRFIYSWHISSLVVAVIKAVSFLKHKHILHLVR